MKQYHGYLKTIRMDLPLFILLLLAGCSSIHLDHELLNNQEPEVLTPTSPHPDKRTEPEGSIDIAKTSQEDNAPSDNLPSDREQSEDKQPSHTNAHPPKEMKTTTEQGPVPDDLETQSQQTLIGRFLISQQLSRQEYDTARYWMNKTGIQPSLRQQLQLALDEGDVEAIEQLLKRLEDDLSIEEKVYLLQRIEHKTEALRLAQEHLASLPNTIETEELASTLDYLAISLSDVVEVALVEEGLGILEVDRTSVLLDLRMGSSSHLITELSRSQLSTTDKDVLQLEGTTEELDASLKSIGDWFGYQFDIKLGGNFRDDDSVVYGHLFLDHNITTDLTGQIGLGLNQITNVTPILRAVGNEDFLSIAVTAQPSRWDFTRAKIDWHRYQTRDDAAIGDGFGIELALGQVVTQELPRWHFELRGSWEENDLVDEVPVELTTSTLKSDSQVSTIIPSSFQLLGVASTLQYGSLARSPKGLFQASIDGFIGWLWPEDQPTYSIQLSLGTSIIARDMLSIDAYYANAANGVADQAYHRLGISYRIHF